MVKPKLFMGLSAVGVMLTTVLFAGQKVANVKAGLVNDFFGLNTKEIDEVKSDLVEGSEYLDANGKMSSESWGRMYDDSMKFCREAVEQGSVLIKNDNNCLPLAKEERKVTLFGTGSKNLFMRSGAGGAAPNEDKVVTMLDGFKKAGFEVNETVYNSYKEFTRQDLAKPRTEVEEGTSIYTPELTGTFDQYNDAAIVTIVRIGTENTDPDAGNLDLRQKEKDLLKMIKDSGKFDKIIVVINSPLAMSMDWIENEEYGIDAAIFMGVPGYYGVQGVADLIAGLASDQTTPIDACGHAPDTFAASASSSAAYQNFGNSSVVVYKEGVYVGYKYYETRYEDCVLSQGNANGEKGIYNSKNGSWNYADEVICPFGYGLSYTTFEQKITGVTWDGEKDQYMVSVDVTNTGNRVGKASVQVYVQQPYTEFDKTNELGRPSIALMNYAKVEVGIGKTVSVTVPVDEYFLTTYDYKVNKGYILEGGDYYFAVGNGAHEALNNILGVKAPTAALTDQWGNAYSANTDAVEKVAISENLTKYRMSIYDDTVEVTNQFDDADYNYYANKNSKTAITYLNRTDWEGTWPTATTSSPATDNDKDMSKKYDASETVADIESSEYDGVLYNVQFTYADGTPYLDETGKPGVVQFVDMVDVPLEGIVEKGKFQGMEGADVWDKFIKQMTIEELKISVSDNRGILDVGRLGKIGNSIAEGPEGILAKFKIGNTQLWATGFPTGPTYTATFDHEMQKKFGGFFGEEALYCGVACINAPGCNINRTPYGSRASEYMTEDGVMNYLCAANVVSQARKKGLVMNIKHCFLNNQESGRQGVETYCNEQAIREIYLRPFEGALTKGNGLGIMTSYNRIGATYAACHKPLMQNVMRGEWHYRGQIIDDALTGNNESKYSNGPAMLYCGTDIFCLDGGRGDQLVDWIKGHDDITALKCLQRANKNIMYSMTRSWLGGYTPSKEDFEKPAWAKTVDALVIVSSVVTGLLIAAYVVFEVLDKTKKPVAAAQ